MNSKRLLIVLGLVVLVAFIGLASVNADQASANGKAIGAVDVQTVFDALQEKIQIEADLKTQIEDLNREEQDRKARLQSLQADLEILAPGTGAFNEKREQLEQEVIELQVWRQVQNQRVARERSIHIERLYRKVLDAIGRLAESDRMDMVLFKEKPVDFSGTKPEALNTLIQMRKVLWVADQLDLTDQVIQMMNNEFENVKP